MVNALQVELPGPDQPERGPTVGSIGEAPRTRCSLCRGTGHPDSQCPVFSRRRNRYPRGKVFDDIVAVFPEPEDASWATALGLESSWAGELPEFFEWTRRARQEASRNEGPCRRCTRCVPTHVPDFKAPILLKASGEDGLRQDGFYEMETGARQLVVIFGTWAEAESRLNLEYTKAARIKVWLPATNSTEQHWAITQQEDPRPLAWDLLSRTGLKTLCDWIRTVRYFQGSAVRPHVRPWVVAEKYAAIFVERPKLDPGLLT